MIRKTLRTHTTSWPPLCTTTRSQSRAGSEISGPSRLGISIGIPARAKTRVERPQLAGIVNQTCRTASVWPRPHDQHRAQAFARQKPGEFRVDFPLAIILLRLIYLLYGPNSLFDYQTHCAGAGSINLFSKLTENILFGVPPDDHTKFTRRNQVG